MDTNKDHLSRRCPMLGGPVQFHYCRTCGEERSLCWKIIDCWWEVFDIKQYLQKTYPSNQIPELLAKRPPSKVGSLVDLIAKAQNRTKETES